MTPEEFEGFFLSVYPQLVRYAQRRAPVDLADDLATAALLNIWEKDVDAPHDEETGRTLRALAYRVLDGYIANALRDNATYRAAVRSYTAEQARRGELPDIADQVLPTLWPGWARGLSATDRKVLALVIDGYKVADIADIIGIKPSAVTARLSRAKRHARKLVEQRAELRRRGVRRGETQ